MKRVFDLSKLDWKVAGYVPDVWRQEKTMELGVASMAAIAPIPAPVPGSVQKALLDAGLVPDWNIGLNARQCEWVENRHWVYEVTLPDDWFTGDARFRLRCMGLDYRGTIRLNGDNVGAFKGSHIPHVFELSPHLAASGNVLQIVFELPPRWLGQCGRTSQMKEWKPRFNYTWDWVSRLVQIGISDGVFLEAADGEEIEDLRVRTDADVDARTGRLDIDGEVRGNDGCRLRVELARSGAAIHSEHVRLSEFRENGLSWSDLDVELWWPNGSGDQPLYSVTVTLIGRDEREIDRVERRVGFKNVRWESCEDAPEGADPWICVVNGLPLFLQGFNWSPIRPAFADVPESEYRKRLELYRDLHVNAFRVNGCAVIEREEFYDLCDELGLLVWQDFPLSSSGIDNVPPADPASIGEMAAIAASAISRRQHHACLLCWCGGNELQTAMDGSDGIGKPLTLSHPMLQRLADVVAELDPGRRFIPTSPAGPRFTAEKEDMGKDLHWEVHGPWRAEGTVEEFRKAYWANDDALFRSEVGAPGPSGAELIRRYRGECSEVPGTLENPLWRRTSWWIEWPQFVEEKGREPDHLEEYVQWGQERQAAALRTAAESCKTRFPKCGGILYWMGHDCFPCTTNTAVIDFEGAPKPAALAIAEVFGARSSAPSNRGGTAYPSPARVLPLPSGHEY